MAKKKVNKPKANTNNNKPKANNNKPKANTTNKNASKSNSNKAKANKTANKAKANKTASKSNKNNKKTINKNSKTSKTKNNKTSKTKNNKINSKNKNNKTNNKNNNKNKNKNSTNNSKSNTTKITSNNETIQNGDQTSEFKSNNNNTINSSVDVPIKDADNYTKFQSNFNKDQAENYGLTYGYDDIKAKFDNATKTQFDVSRQQAAQNENQFYWQNYTGQQTALDTLKKSQSEAIANGASRGAQAANALSVLLAGQQDATQQATELAQARANLNAEEQAAYAQNATQAVNDTNTLGSNLYSTDTQFNLGKMEAYAAENTAAQARASQFDYNNAYREESARNLEGNKYNADQNLVGTKYNANQNLIGTKYNADQNLKGQQGYNKAYRAANK